MVGHHQAPMGSESMIGITDEAARDRVGLEVDKQV